MTKSTLFVAGGWAKHQPQQTSELFADLLRAEGYNTTIANTLDVFLEIDSLKQFDLIVPVWSMGKISDQQAAGLVDAVVEGAGLGGWHGGIADAFRENTRYQFMVGGQWVAHPGNIIDYTVQITNIRHPITAGLNDFAMHSEQYYMVTQNFAVLNLRVNGDHRLPPSEFGQCCTRKSAPTIPLSLSTFSSLWTPIVRGVCKKGISQ